VPGSSDQLTAHLQKGRACRARDDFREAAEWFRKAVALDPASGEALADLADALTVLGQLDEAIPYWQRALEQAPDNALWRCGLADALHAQGRLGPAAEVYQAAVAGDAGLLRAWWGLGCVYLTLQDYAAAAEALGRAVALDPDNGLAQHNLGSALFDLGQMNAALDAYAKALALLSPNVTTLAAIATMIPGAPRADHRAILEARRRWAALAAPEQPPRIFARPAGDRPLRLGYVCAFFQDRNWMKPVWSVINHHDRDRFEVHLFSDAPAARIEHGYCQDPRDRFHDVTAQSNADLARHIEDQAIDVLIDLNGFSGIRRLPLFALRPAPVQVAWFSMFATSGMNCFDALVTDPNLVLADEEPYYSEPVVRLPGYWLTFEVTYPVPDVAPAPSLSRRGLTFGCLAPQYKLTGAVLQAWARILHGSPESRLLLKNRALSSSGIRRFVHDVFARAGIDPERVELDGPAEHYAFLKRYDDIDIALDTFPYNGGTSTAEAVWQGVPVLCFVGDRWVARISASLMRYAGLSEFVVPDLEGYIARAVELANDPGTPAQLDALRGSMRDRLRESPACAVEAYTRDMEGLYRLLWERWCGSESRS
jgi:predicted O-linked N-acetylglucosamine transferase (SPINDLY family)